MLDITQGPQRRSRIRRMWLRIARNVVILVLVVAMLLMGVRFAYQWYREINNGSPMSVTYTKTTDEKIMPEVVMSATDGSMTTTVQQITSPVAPSDSAALTVSTAPKAQCTIQVQYPQNKLAQDQKLVPKPADATGKVTWAWVVRADTTPGTGTAVVTCVNQIHSTRVVAKLVIANKTTAGN